MLKIVEDMELFDLIDYVLLFEGVKKIVLNDYLIKFVKNGVVLDEC